MSKTINAQVLHVVKTTAEWQSETKIISEGLLCIETTTDGKVLAKVGDGVGAYASLPYLGDGSFSIADYYTKTQTDSAISTAISGLGTIFKFKGVVATKDELPLNGEPGDVWLVGDTASADDNYEEYLWAAESSNWEYLGKRQIETDLSDYAKTADVTAHTTNKNNPHGVTKTQIGLGNVENKSSATIRGELTKANVTDALGYTPPEQDTTYENATTSKAGLMSAEDKTTLDTVAADYIKSTDTLILKCTL